MRRIFSPRVFSAAILAGAALVAVADDGPFGPVITTTVTGATGTITQVN